MKGGCVAGGGRRQETGRGWRQRLAGKGIWLLALLGMCWGDQLVCAQSAGQRVVQVEVYDLRDDGFLQDTMEQHLKQRLQALAEELTGRQLSSRQLAREVLWLRQQPGVEEHSAKQEEVDPLTGRKRICYQRKLCLPHGVLQAWESRLRWRPWYGGGWGVLGTLLWSVLIWILVKYLDFWTRGYYRGLIVSSLGLTWLAGIASWGTYIYLNYFA
jgi:hypothetical protein